MTIVVVVEFSTFGILFWFISVPAGICFLCRAFSTICMFFNILVFNFSRTLQFSVSPLMSTRIHLL